MRRSERIAQFDDRCKAEPSSVRIVEALGRFLPVNPMSDESALLSELGLSSSSCNKVDLYWEFQDDIRFVQIQAAAYASRSPGMYARKSPSGYLNIVVVVPEAEVSSDIVVKALRGIATRSVTESAINDTLRQID
jgi:hypothetical protein